MRYGLRKNVFAFGDVTGLGFGDGNKRSEAMTAFNFQEADLTELTQLRGRSDVGSPTHTMCVAELERRQFISTSKFTIASVSIAACAAVFSAISAGAAAYSVWPKK